MQLLTMIRHPLRTALIYACAQHPPTKISWTELVALLFLFATRCAGVAFCPIVPGNPEPCTVMRLGILLWASVCENCFAYAVRRTLGPLVGLYVVVFLSCSGGMFFASVSLLPPSLAMHCSLLVWSLYFRGWLLGAVLGVVLTVLLTGWPYVALAFLPLLLQAAFVRGPFIVFRWIAVASAVVLPSLALIDCWSMHRCGLAAHVFFRDSGFWASSNNGATQGVGGLGAKGAEAAPWYHFAQLLVSSFHVLIPVALDATNSIEHLSQGMGHCVAPLHSLLLWLLTASTSSMKAERYLHVMYPLVCLAAGISANRWHLHYGWRHPRYYFSTGRPSLKKAFVQHGPNAVGRWPLFGAAWRNLSPISLAFILYPLISFWQIYAIMSRFPALSIWHLIMGSGSHVIAREEF